MNKDILEGKWRQFKGEMQSRWGDLTDDQLEEIDGDTEKLIGQIQENQGIAREEAKKQIEEWEKKIAS